MSIDWSFKEIMGMLLIDCLLILDHFWRKNGRAHHMHLYGSGTSKSDQKVGLLDGSLYRPLSQNGVIINFPLNPSTWIIKKNAIEVLDDQLNLGQGRFLFSFLVPTQKN